VYNILIIFVQANCMKFNYTHMSRNIIHLTLLSFFFLITPLVSTASVTADPFKFSDTPDTGPAGAFGEGLQNCNKNEYGEFQLCGFRLCNGPTPKSIPRSNDWEDAYCDHNEFKCRFGVEADCVETSQGYSWSCLMYHRKTWSKDSIPKSARCSISKKRLDAKCSAAKDTCATGKAGNFASIPEAHMWTCFGEGGGSNDQCQILIPQKIDGKCGKLKETCSKGKVTDIYGNGSSWTWKCSGENGGNSASCSELKPYKGACGLQQNTCTAGSSTRQVKYTEKYMWACQGVGSGSLTPCSMNRVTAGECSTTEVNKCKEGYPADTKVTATANTWTCTGIGGAADTPCTKNFSPKNGICSSSHYKCAKGIGINQLTTTDVWSWVCPGLFGGTSASCIESMGVKKGSCSVIKHQCKTGTPSNITEDAVGYKWTCVGPNKGGDTSCETKKKTEGVCSDTQNTCVSGTFFTKADSRTMYNWTCKGIAGGGSESCSLPKNTASSTIAICSKEHYACTEGLSINEKEGKTAWTWTCDGGSGGKNANCSELKIIDTTGKIDGACGDAQKTCVSGNLLVKSETKTMYNWTCKGIAGGGSESCSLPKNIASSTIAVCSKEHYACTEGLSVNEKEGKTAWTWTCDGGSGGKNANCSEVKIISIIPSINTTSTTCSLTDTACLLSQCNANSVCEDTIKKCVKGEINCVENFVIIPNASGTTTPGSCPLNDLSCLTKQCDGNVSCEATLKQCNDGNITCVKDLNIQKNIVENIECQLTDVKCLISQCNGSVTCEDTIKKCVKGELNCVEDFVINPDASGVPAPGSCSLNDLNCLLKQCKDNLVCEDTITNCSNGSATCINNLIIDPGIIIEGGNDICAVGDMDCLIKKCNGDVACIENLKKCDPSNATCLNDSLLAAGTTLEGPGLSQPESCEKNNLKCLLAKCNGNLACEASLRKCKLSDVKCINLALSKRNSGWGPSYKENNGTCSAEIFSCKYGTNSDNIRDTESYRWSCIGKNGGNSSNCIVLYPKDAVCSSKTHNTCDTGKPTKISETLSVWNWTCKGIGAGKSTTCSMNIVPLDGVCSVKVQSCEVGKVSSFRVNGDWNEWTCSGVYGGKNTDCFKEIKGSCSLKRYTCDSGSVDSKTESTSGYGWKCRGTNGDLTVSCFEKKLSSNQATPTSTISMGTSEKSSFKKAVSITISFIDLNLKLISKTVDNLFALI
jgi:hypothetical protein